MTTIAIIGRDAADSPNMVANDAAIIECVAGELQASGAMVIRPGGGTLPTDVDVVCHMSRTQATLQMLAKAEGRGVIVINTPSAVNSCSRLRVMQALTDAGITQPEYQEITTLDELDRLPYPAWIKRSEGWSNHKEDVCFASNCNEARDIFSSMMKRGIESCVHCRHIEGDIIKFYAVGEECIHYCYPDPKKSKFGHEHINGKPHHYPFDVEMMKSSITSAAKATGIEIYGGDCIVDKKGDIYIIDLNDFPSFTAVRHEAARKIARYIIKKKDERRR